jgi:hypothetical protein
MSFCTKQAARPSRTRRKRQVHIRGGAIARFARSERRNLPSLRKRGELTARFQIGAVSAADSRALSTIVAVNTAERAPLDDGPAQPSAERVIRRRSSLASLRIAPGPSLTGRTRPRAAVPRRPPSRRNQSTPATHEGLLARTHGCDQLHTETLFQLHLIILHSCLGLIILVVNISADLCTEILREPFDV